MARVVLNPFGSLGDLHPYLAIALGLRSRGHEAVIATSEVYRAKIEAEGIGFSAVRPDVGELMGDARFLDKLWHPRLGTEYLLREYIVPRLEQSYEDLSIACERADVVLTHTASYAGRIAAEILKIPWISVALQPTVFFSAYDPPVLAPAPWLRHFYRFGPFSFKALLALGKYRVASWAEPIVRFRRRLGLRTAANPILDGQFSPLGTLALFSRHFAAPQPDWPPNTAITGFAFYDREDRNQPMDDDLIRFLQHGPAPVLFTLGSSAVLRPGTFYRESVAAAESLGVRAVLLTGRLPREQFPPSSALLHVGGYAPYSEIMPKAAIVVHQGGIGTTAQALRAGRPMLVIPWAHDQPDNAERARKLGVGRTISRRRYTRARAASELTRLLNDGDYGRRASEVRLKIASEDGVSKACDAIEAILSGRPQSASGGS